MARSPQNAKVSGRSYFHLPFEVLFNVIAPMNEIGKFGTENSVSFERLLPSPIERVWEILTDTKLLPGWFGNGMIEPRVGGVVSFLDGHIKGTVTQWKPPHRLAYTWNVYGPGDTDSPYPESYLTFELESRGKGVLLILTHLPVLGRFVKQNAMGWHTFLDMLGAVARGETPEPRGYYMKRNAERYGVDLSDLTR